MGCCQSTDRGEDPAAPGGRLVRRASPRDAYASTLPANILPSVTGASASPTATRGGVANTSSVPFSVARPNNPIRAPSPLPSSPTTIAHQPPPWTRAQLAREREAFFDTRVSGSREVWAGLRVVAETLRQVRSEPDGGISSDNIAVSRDTSADPDTVNAKVNGEGRDEALVTAQTLIDALNVTCPEGRVAAGRGRNWMTQGGLYDERGALYELPAWVVRDPDDLLPDEHDSNDEKGLLTGTAGTPPTADESSEREKFPAPRRRSDFKGKGRAEDFGEQIAVRARLSDRARDVVIRVGERQPVSTVLSAVRAEIGLDPEPESDNLGYSTPKDFPRVRLFYFGKMMVQHRSLAENGWNSNHVINAFVYFPEENQA